ncbi:alpha/beta fold hydrolase [Kitasatospora atroaurantiaca]|uniref:Surfactin synthase thioesterase subunit n=1 Tax=Kitasatospora atroaurantiaca TaxID=285545 RepID=A0A561EVH0_9ACTN|nr:alpha/beta fold hydrolase [Kitasatospora atroaurantiaca]TWE19607.1 surfactin synthase thioesterase subunit [Kitasatospora atroaurantiaca]
MNQWLQPAETDPEAPLRLFLFHYAGGGASMYRDWPPLLPGDIAYQCIQMPGRQERRTEAAFTDIEPLVDMMAEQIAADLDDRPFAFFGHCMGGQLAYRTAVALERAGERGPSLLGVASWAPEGFHTVPPEQADRPQAEILEWMGSLGSMPEEILQDKEMLSMLIPVMRADLQVCASYRDDAAAVSCPVVTYSAKTDPLVESAAMASWRSRTPDYLGNSEFVGGHFFIHDEALAISADFTRLMRRYAGAVTR